MGSPGRSPRRPPRPRQRVLCLLGGIFLGALPAAPAGLVCPEPLHEFGTVSTGSRVPHTFRLRNTGPETLTITDIDSPCGCMESPPPGQPIAPGEEIDFPVILDLQGRTGPQNRRVYLRANHSLEPSLTLTMRGHATEGLQVQPAILVLQEGQAGDAWQGRVAVLPPDAEKIELVSLQCANPDWEFTPGELPGQPGFTLVATRLSAPPPGQEKTSVSLRTTHPLFPETHFQILTVAATGLRVAPAEIEIPESPGTFTSRSVLVQDPEAGELVVLHAELPQDGMFWETSSTGPGLLQIILGDIHPVPQLDGQKVRIHFDGPGARTIEIPFRITPAEAQE